MNPRNFRFAAVLSLFAFGCTVTAGTGPGPGAGTGAPIGPEPTATAVPTTPATAVTTPVATATAAPTATIPVGSVPSGSPTGAPTTAPTGTTQPGGPSIGANYVLVLKQTGGIAGLNQETTLDAAAKKMTYGGLKNQKAETRDLTVDEVARITRAVDAAGVPAFSGTLKSKPIADAFSYVFTLRTGGKDHVLSWADGATVPQPIDALRTALVKLRDEKFRSGAGTNAPKE